MDDEPQRPPDAGVSESAVPLLPGGVTANAEPGAAAVPPLPALPHEITANAEEVRRLIDAGASSPEELRALAARIREHRALEESLWRAEVKPALIQAKKAKFTLRDLREPVDTQQRSATGLKLGLGILAVVAALVLAAAQSSILWILVPVVAVLVIAYRQGREQPHPSAEAPPATGAHPPGDPLV